MLMTKYVNEEDFQRLDIGILTNKQFPLNFKLLNSGCSSHVSVSVNGNHLYLWTLTVLNINLHAFANKMQCAVNKY